MADTNELIHKIGGILLRNAEAEPQPWDYVGWVFALEDGVNYADLRYKFLGKLQKGFEFAIDKDEAVAAMMELRDLSKGDDGVPWLEAMIAIRNSDNALRILFEFEDPERWSIGPGMLSRRFEILVGEAFPEALDESGAQAATRTRAK
ncbi:MAG TPA: hypothetical protein DEF51_32330 [Myxococcales bacterium]|nr:hypothetical protein [Myxococcales bacterium]|tara:strand:+ start:265 stop:708 length:444 start_codon:yes stop_codon:yes gene_type:complete